ncbi:aldehyde dehydrogenase family protein [Psychrobacter sanguinis]|uniref:aldehyde dehydrogenase family protein n=1 Tax=Psychrobacter sanguinis TaxID=861445 RepID=UPI00191B2A05|nr:aldehyde dehydrogenase family protein [Psychrobacter sanguinis]MCC3308231.1 aldehyde dehydrogenase family protein [Psychrobacter sanguinis]UEC25503.1 aldehyde dehydrogenase family protein [Psychrobacter sanguinis]
MQHFYPLYLANKAHEGADDALEVVNKYNQETVAEVARSDSELLEQAIQKGLEAVPAMQALKPYQKQRILLDCVAKFTERFDEFTEALIAEGGKPEAAAKAEVKRLIATFQFAADAVTTVPEGEVLPLDSTEASAGYRGFSKRVPIGLCGFISPFNFPLNLVAHKIAPAIAAGCPFILKPASYTPIGALMIADVLAETDLPEGAFSILPMSSKVADVLVTDERIKLLSFTGSDKVGWDMKARAGKKKVVLELGGNAAVMIEPDADLEKALPRVITGGYSQAGQVCISVQRVLIHKDIYQSVKDELVALAKEVKSGDPSQADVVIGPMIDKGELERIQQWIDEAVGEGATLLCGGEVDGLVMNATILENVSHESKLYKDEAFGPVMILEAYDNFDKGIELANDSRFGLQVGVYSSSINKAMQAWDHIEAGGVIINDVPTFRVDNMPYGGVKDSGFGREGVKYAIEDMTEIRLMVIKD